jgi:hypothetical protein
LAADEAAASAGSGERHGANLIENRTRNACDLRCAGGRGGLHPRTAFRSDACLLFRRRGYRGRGRYVRRNVEPVAEGRFERRFVALRSARPGPRYEHGRVEDPTRTGVAMFDSGWR